ncbi:hypothetical protein [Pontiella sulfatireligans]|uniref:Uncharacterized protein n=1 Tax=Pontiella sulfatireligans TaxID=2750658 RepID=A0A6C2UK46_9BACT|nr:hypothetical protein [Pontiella sulfatireligans]VGO19684.1 hypothetical protein SCARR_01743 [Pontiella sulfatireligans]
MSMLDVAKFLSYSKSVDHVSDKDRYFNLSAANSGRLRSCLYSDHKRTMGAEQPPVAEGKE